ncbi:MAG: sugar ABC transporter permease [Epulopiscium sp. Nele67-Bin002]|nr:MAG: sugar ABC transporter permease [Epulopiscium sp. Nuni2H_MBin001]OON92326.1 MAG: sugar ABC transporter permease [Epulopiscium sp. Nele67-Bin002]
MKVKMTKREVPFNIISCIILLIIGLVMISPFIIMVIFSLERYANLQPPFPITFSIQEPSFFNFKIILENGDILTAYINSFIVAIGSVAINLFSVMLAGFAFSKGKFAGKKIMLAIILATMMIPFETRMIPMYLMFTKFGLKNNFLALILPSIVDGFGILLVKGFFDTIPDSLMEAAQIDGCNKWQIFIKIFVPFTGPIAATLIILKFMASWNSLLWPLVILTDKSKQTVPIFISSFATENGSRLAGSTMAAAFLGIIPVVLVFLLLQKHIIESIATTGLKE